MFALMAGFLCLGMRNGAVFISSVARFLQNSYYMEIFCILSFNEFIYVLSH